MQTMECERTFEVALYLSAHEMAALILLRQAPIDQAMGTPDVLALHNAGLAQLIAAAPCEFKFAITSAGKAALRALGVAHEPSDNSGSLFHM